jgi:two-component system OmpR family response regulator
LSRDPAEQQRVIIVGPSTTEADLLERWGEELQVKVSRTPLDEPVGLGDTRPVFAVIDAGEDPPLAVAECARLHARHPALPLVLLGTTEVCLERAALRAGATVFLPRPIALDRLRSYTQRFAETWHAVRTDRSILLGAAVRLDVHGRRLHVDGKEHTLTADGFRLLQYLVQRPGKAVSADELVEAGVLLPGQKSRYRAAIFELRKQMRTGGALISSVRGFGYRFDLRKPE